LNRKNNLKKKVFNNKYEKKEKSMNFRDSIRLLGMESNILQMRKEFSNNNYMKDKE